MFLPSEDYFIIELFFRRIVRLFIDSLVVRIIEERCD